MAKQTTNKTTKKIAVVSAAGLPAIAQPIVVQLKPQQIKVEDDKVIVAPFTGKSVKDMAKYLSDFSFDRTRNSQIILNAVLESLKLFIDATVDSKCNHFLMNINGAEKVVLYSRSIEGIMHFKPWLDAHSELTAEEQHYEFINDTFINRVKKYNFNLFLIEGKHKTLEDIFTEYELQEIKRRKLETRLEETWNKCLSELVDEKIKYYNTLDSYNIAQVNEMNENHQRRLETFDADCKRHKANTKEEIKMAKLALKNYSIKYPKKAGK